MQGGNWNEKRARYHIAQNYSVPVRWLCKPERREKGNRERCMAVKWGSFA